MTTRPLSTRLDEQEIDAIFAPLNQCQLPGAAVAIAIGGMPVYRKGFGRANMELPSQLTPTTRMRIGSTSKHFAALAYLLLCEDGMASLDDEIGAWVPKLHPVTAQATLRQLMSHTSGIHDVFAVTMTMNGVNHPLSEQAMLAMYEHIDVRNFAAGTRWDYNNGAYMLLCQAIEKITGKLFDDVLRERIFEPVGMHDTALRRWDSDFVDNCATLHFFDASGAWSRATMGIELSGAGGVISTMDDMLRWLRHMDAPVVGCAETWQLLRRPQQLANGTTTGYGFGLVSETYRGVETLHHAGGVLGGNSQMIKVPAAQLDISVAVNRGDVNGAMLANQIIDACVEGLDAQPELPAFESRNGSFQSAQSARVITLTAANDMQLMSVDGGPALPVKPDADGVLQLPAVMAFLRQAARVENETLVFTEFGHADLMTEIDVDTEVALGERAGSYRADAFGARFTLSEDRDGPQAISHGRFGPLQYKLQPINADIWRIEHPVYSMLSAIIRFDADGAGFSLDASRMRNVRFQKEATAASRLAGGHEISQ